MHRESMCENKKDVIEIRLRPKILLCASALSGRMTYVWGMIISTILCERNAAQSWIQAEFIIIYNKSFVASWADKNMPCYTVCYRVSYIIWWTYLSYINLKCLKITIMSYPLLHKHEQIMKLPLFDHFYNYHIYWRQNFGCTVIITLRWIWVDRAMLCSESELIAQCFKIYIF